MVTNSPQWWVVQSQKCAYWGTLPGMTQHPALPPGGGRQAHIMLPLLSTVLTTLLYLVYRTGLSYAQVKWLEISLSPTKHLKPVPWPTIGGATAESSVKIKDFKRRSRNRAGSLGLTKESCGIWLSLWYLAPAGIKYLSNWVLLYLMKFQLWYPEIWRATFLSLSLSVLFEAKQLNISGCSGRTKFQA